MSKLLRVHAPSVTLVFWTLVFAAGREEQLLVVLALLTVAVSIVVHTCEIIRTRRRRR